METLRHNMRRLSARLAVLATMLLLTAAGTSRLSAQEPEVNWVQEEKARIGVLLEERCDALMRAEERCGQPPVVSSVVVNGPADLAGVQARDTLLSVDGLDVTTLEGRAALLGLEAGVPVQLGLARASGRMTIRVTPEMRPAEPWTNVRTMFFGPPEELAEDASGGVRVVRIPSLRARLNEVEVRLESLRTHGNAFVFFHEDDEGSFKIEVGDPEKAGVILQRMREHDGRLAQARVVEGQRSEADVTQDEASGTRVEVRVDLPGYVWENEELARRLVRVRDSSFRSARVHLDSLVRLRAEVRTLGTDSLGLTLSVTSRTDPRGEWAYYVAHRPVPGQLRTLLLSDLRVAGAEFRELGGSLADYFEGVDEGLLVLRVIRDTPADRMGLRDGDVVVEVDEVNCSSVATLRQVLADAEHKGFVEVKWVRKGKHHTGRLDTH
jgi:membrane-associated protease RseP (regulator of RpoE activity)